MSEQPTTSQALQSLTPDLVADAMPIARRSESGLVAATHEGHGVIRALLYDETGAVIDAARFRLVRVHASSARVEDQA